MLAKDMALMCPYTVSSCDEHSMGNYLKRYIDIKIHPLIEDGDYKSIIVAGDYDRSDGVSTKEKNDKMYNWQRPTALIRDKTLFLSCFPGKDYVRHYASLVATYLSLSDKPHDIVRYSPPSEEKCWEPILFSEYLKIPISDDVIVGYNLSGIFPGQTWSDLDNYYTSVVRIGGKNHTLLMVKHSFWGDIAGRLTKLLASIGFRRVIFVGKLGALNAKDRPNEMLATGNQTLVEGEMIKWNNIFHNETSRILTFGHHITTPSVLYETKLWLESTIGYFRYVDPEIGHMARAAQMSNIDFSYLHIISDNVANQRPENLSNERQTNVLIKRYQLIGEINRILVRNL